ncbi:hypothetical protein BDY19DRAFT_902747 [Irpex rosettiformis]|uniref:Uncharacterized protein n=1 Tax=Irpex rosettiformis TaxID=378272 RepID=A0ACB8UI91_9APHY|nr:hypothetical protein BDY19DRAFT_902747 [Irpex rosettiformis]
MGGLTLQQGAGTPPADRRRHTNEYTRGFYEDRGFRNRDGERDKPLPARPPPFPQPDLQWQPTRYPAPGPLPAPPAMAMPEPQPFGKPAPSLTSQYAQEIWNGKLAYPQLTAMGPQTPHLPPRPSSDPSVPKVSESISGLRPEPPSTPKRGNAFTPSQHPATLPKPVKDSGSHFSPAGTPTKPSRKRSASTSALPPSGVTLTPSGTLQCSGLTQAGQRCKKMAKVDPVLAYVLGDDEDDNDDGIIQVYCSQHKDKVLDKKEFLSPVTGEYVKFDEYIPSYLEPATQTALRALMTKLASKADRDGYIYGFEILDPDNDEYVFFKVGRTVKLNKRMDEWAKQCGSKSQHLRGRWPEMPGDDAPDLMGRLQEGHRGKFCFRLERLIHVELADLALNGQYLLPGFPTVSPDFTDNGSPKAKLKKKCVDCGKMHKEIFAFQRPQKGRFHKHEWELIVKQIIHKWGRFVEEHVVQESKD